MTDEPTLRVLASRQSLPQITRRAFLAGFTVTAAAGGSLVLSACGNSSDQAGTTSSPSAAPTGPVEDKMNMFSWADYDDPALLKQFAKEVGPTITITVFDSNEQAIAKLNTAQGTAGYDVMNPTGNYIPLMVQQQLLQPLDRARLTNFDNILPEYLTQEWDPDNKYSVPKDWGTTGFMYDKSVVTRKMETWQDFVDAMQNEAANNTAVLATAANLCSLYFWTQDPPGDWNSTDQAEWDDKVRPYILNEVAPYVKSYDSYPGITQTQGKYALSMIWNGDARAGLTRGDNPENFQWVFPGPTTEIWMDTWTVVQGAPNPNAAYAWINFILEPENSFTDLKYHGYNTAIKGVEEKAKAEKIPFPEIIFFSPEQVATMSPGLVNENLDWSNRIFQEAKAKSAG
jgi:spermidine/putrescine transport system substrate-binding protein